MMTFSVRPFLAVIETWNLSQHSSIFHPRLLPHASVYGCIRNVRVNGVLLDLGGGASASSLGNDPPPPDAGCPRERRCFPNPCLRGGSCIGGWTQHSCDCPRDYTGANCTESECGALTPTPVQHCV